MSPNLTRGSQLIIDKTDIENGKIRFAIDTARLFIDTANERIEITDFIKGLKYSQIIALENPLPKVYLSSDTHQLLSYDYDNEVWVTYSGGGGSIDPSTYITDLYYNDDGDTVLVYGDGSEQTRVNHKLKELEEMLSKFTNAIEIEKVTK